MAATGFVNRYQRRGLDPSAQEFRPRNPIPIFTLPPPPPPPPQLLPHRLYFPYPTPPPPPPPHLPMNDVITVPYVPSAPAYVSSLVTVVNSPIPPPAAAPTRAVLLSPVPCDVSEVIVRREMEGFGEVRWVQMERSCEGIVIVHFYDLRDAEKALREMRELHMQHQSRNVGSSSGCSNRSSSSIIVGSDVVWPHFVIPVHSAMPEGHNQGTIVIFNLDSAMSNHIIKKTFQAFGAVKELRETPAKKHQKFVEFFHVRHAARALSEMNGKEFYGKQILIEFSRPGGNSWKKLNSLTTNNVVVPAANITSLPEKTLPGGHSRFNAGSPPMFSTGNYSGFGNAAHVDSQMGEFSLGGIEEIQERQARRVLTKKAQTGPGIVTSPRPQPRSSRGKRGSQPKKYDARFIIKEDTILESTSVSRTTLMIKNIPNKYSLKLLLSMLDNHCIHCNDRILREGDDQPLSSYNFVYLPIDFNNKCNVGYGFVNMTSPEATWRLYKAFHHQNWEVFNSRKICEVTYARVQGLEALKEHFKNSKFPSEMDHHLPVVFTPASDGKRLTDPQPIFGVQHKSSSSNSSSSSVINHPITLLLPTSHQSNTDGSMDETSTDHCNGGEVGLNDDEDEDEDEDDDQEDS